MITAHGKTKLLGSSHPSVSTCQVAGPTSSHYHTQLPFILSISLSCLRPGSASPLLLRLPQQTFLIPTIPLLVICPNRIPNLCPLFSISTYKHVQISSPTMGFLSPFKLPLFLFMYFKVYNSYFRLQLHHFHST